jgi:hypothetical protein
VRLGPADVHAREHRRPVAALGAAGAGVDLEEGVVAVGLAVEQRLDLLLRGAVAQGRERGLGLGHDLRVALGLAELDQFALVVEFLRQRRVSLDGVREGLAVAHQLLRPGRVVPQIGILRHRVQLLEPVRRGVPVEPLAQEAQRLLDLCDDVFGFSAHECFRERRRPQGPERIVYPRHRQG